LTKHAGFVIRKQEETMKIPIVISFSLAAFLWAYPLCSLPAFADENLKERMTNKLKEEKDVCKVVKKTILEGVHVKEVTKTGIEAGYDACLVIRCAIEAEGNLEHIILGALEAGTTSDVCSRCAVDAGAAPADIAKVLETGLGYSPLAAGLAPVEIGLPGGNRGGGMLSPESF
jgi:hypothetical protein